MNAATAGVFDLIIADPSVPEADLLRTLSDRMPQAAEPERQAALADAREKLARAGLIDR